MKEYTYTYEAGKITRSTECDITVETATEIVTGKTMVGAVAYQYEAGHLAKKVVMDAGGNALEYTQEYPKDENMVIKFSAGGRTVTSHSKTDSFGRKAFDELQLGKGFLSRQFSYHMGRPTEEHLDNGLLKSSPTTSLVKSIVCADGRTMSYEYDAEERITKVTDSVDGVREYTYDAQGQLTSETVNGVKTAYEYDRYGNILAKGICGEDGAMDEAGKITYTYGDATWKDLLTDYNGQAIGYDEGGNPVSYLGHTLTWEKGRQLKSFDGNAYTYNANGIRTSKTVSGVEHRYQLEGTKIVRETWGSNTLIPLYDNEDSVCGVIYNGTPFYFYKNLQGDIIAITDMNGAVKARYTYDAWGVCTITEDNSGRNIAAVNPFRYRGYYYDTEIGMYYLQSRYYDPTVGRFVNVDDAEYINIGDAILNRDMFIYCGNNPINDADLTGFFSINTLFDMLGDLFNKITQKFIDYINSLFIISKNMIKISTTLITIAVDVIIASIISGFVAYGVKKVLKLILENYLKNNTGKAIEFVKSITIWFTSSTIGKFILKQIIKLILRKMGKGSNAFDTLMSGFITNILNIHSKVIDRIASLASALSSVGGFIAFMLDICDGEWDDYLTIKFASESPRLEITYPCC